MKNNKTNTTTESEQAHFFARPCRNALHRLATTLAAAMIFASVAAAGDNDGQVFAPNSTVHERSYGQWAALWWQWALSIPEAENPILDSTGQFCGVGQSGPVWFLSGTFGGDAVRTCTIPRNTPIFMPVHNWIFGAGAFDCTPTVPDVICDVDTLRAKAADAATSVEVMEVTIDGALVSNIPNYRSISPQPFSVTFPAGAVFGIPEGTHYPHVADGYWLMLKPLKKGQHTITVTASNPTYGVDLNVVHYLTVE